MKKILKNQLSMMMMMALTFCMPVMASNQHPPAGSNTLSGIIRDAATTQAVPYATVALFDTTGTILMGGTATSEEGAFSFSHGDPGSYLLRTSAIGYQTDFKNISINGSEITALGNIYLQPEQVSLQGIEVVGQRIKATTQEGKTSFLVNTTMQKASHTGTDIIKLIPGIQVDIMQNISLEGNDNIMILVNGRQRDRAYISQLKASRIDRVEVISNPTAQYDAGVSGVINIILNNDTHEGMQGQIYAEIPTSGSEVFIFPNYNLSYGSGKFNFFTSYNGELSYFDIEESTLRRTSVSGGMHEISSVQAVRQKNWSHRFHYGVDFLMNEKNQFNFYGFYNPYSQEHDGQVLLEHNTTELQPWSARKEDHDRNHSNFYSLYYKHLFDPEGSHELSAEAGYHNMKGLNQTTFTNHQTGYHQEDILRPNQQTLRARLDYQLPLGARTRITAGVQARNQKLLDAERSAFSYSNRVLSFHGSVNQVFSSKFNMTAGMRYEQSNIRQQNEDATNSAWLPVLSADYKISSPGNISFSWRSTLIWPDFYQLNPGISIPDPYTQYTGNADLQPVRQTMINLNYSHKFENQFVSSGIFYQEGRGVINFMSSLNDHGILEHKRQNMGMVTRYGLQMSAALSAGPAIGFNPAIKVFQVVSTPNGLAQSQGMIARRQIALSGSFSAFARLGRDYTASVIFQYASPVNEIQANYYEGAQYFLSLEKDFGHGIKAGVVSAVPLAGSLIYRGSEIDQIDLYDRSQGEILTSAVPFWLKISYQFSSGTRREKIERRQEEIKISKRKGF
ncbi:MAG: TonB-dependent receptor [Bacteroidales bacterium]